MDNIISRGGLDTLPATVSLATVDFVAKDLDLTPPRGVIVQHPHQDVHRRVRSTVIHEDIFQVLQGLFKQTAGAPFDVLLDIVYQDYDTYCRPHIYFLEKTFDIP